MLKNSDPCSNIFIELWTHLSSKRRKQYAFLLIMMFLTSIVEVLSIGAVVPFLAVLASPERIFHVPIVSTIAGTFNLTSPQQIILPFTLIFGIAAIASGGMRLALLWVNGRLSYAIGSELSSEIFRRTLYQPYPVHCIQNSSEIIDGVSNKTNEAIYVLNMVATFISSVIMFVIIFAALLWLDPFIALITFSCFGSTYIAIAWMTKKKLSQNSKFIASESVALLKLLQESLGGIRDVLIDGTQTLYCAVYKDSDGRLRSVQASSGFIAASPRFALEALGMVLISSLSYLLILQKGGIAEAIPVLGALALGAQRLLPILQQSYSAWAGIKGSHASIAGMLKLLNQPLPRYLNCEVAKTMHFEVSISLNKVDFSFHAESPLVLRGINLNIEKGSRIGIIGITGSGKSTLIDVIMGLLQPTGGVVLIDGKKLSEFNQRSWQSKIAHVPQTIFLADTSVAENIAFGLPRNQIDMNRVQDVARKAQISSVIEQWENQYETIVGERGIRLSGGQRQRIGIARALYKKASVIILDEATSSLDSTTESAVMEAIEEGEPELTYIIIAHRLSTLKRCTQIFDLQEGRICRHGTFSELIGIQYLRNG